MAAMKPFMKHPDLFTKRLLRSDLFAKRLALFKTGFSPAATLSHCRCAITLSLPLGSKGRIIRYTGGAMVFLSQQTIFFISKTKQ